ncbi:MAG: phospho-sugar mutase [Acidobacteria bacterium]|nr:phospho-sugar mutase [Acidobacteriota bacterium]
MTDDLYARAEAWLREDPDPETAREVAALLEAKDETALLDRFGARLEFGTAGLRGVLGAGPNRMNRAMVRKATAGLARYLLAVHPRAREEGVVVARDGRRGSAIFAKDAASVLAGHGIPAHVFEDLAPTPLGAFAVRELHAAAGVVVTASHNPPEYNGYKVYWTNGAQIVPPVDAGISREIDAAGPANEIPFLEEAAARERGLWLDVVPGVAERYLERVTGLQLHAGQGRDLTIVTTALHGVGGVWLLELLSRAGFSNVHPVAAQQQPDGAFPTVRFPNPEEPGALDLALALAEETKADLILANDPDADRLAVVARDAKGRMKAFTGNEIGVLLGHYRLTEVVPRPRNPLLLATIVSSAQLGVIARDLGARFEETLTGFKWIMNRAVALEETEDATFVFGYEEALGYCPGDVVRDKDGLSSALVFADLAGWCRSHGLTVWDRLEEIQRAHGLFLSAQKSVTFTGRSGPARMAGILEAFRAAPPTEIGGLSVVSARDYARAEPATNAIAYELEGGSRVTLRPSGTEPKIKYYFELRVSLPEGEDLGTARARGEERLASLVDAFAALAEANTPREDA